MLTPTGPQKPPDPRLESLGIPDPEPPDYTVKLSAAARDELGQRLLREYRAFQSATSDRRGRATDFWRLDVRLSQSNQEGPWENACQLRSPFVRMACQNHATRLNNLLTAWDPPFIAKPYHPSAVDAAPKIEDAVAASLRRPESGFDECMRGIHQEIPIVGPAAVRLEWVETLVRRPDWAVETDPESSVTLAQAGVDQLEAYKAPMRTDAQGRPKLELQFKDEIGYAGNEFTPIRFEDVVYLPVSAPAQRDLWAVGHRIMLRGFDLQQGADEGRFIKAGVEAILARQSGDSVPEETLAALEQAGVDPEAGRLRRDSLYQLYECLELDVLDDLNHDGKMEWYMVGLHVPTGQVYRGQYSPYWHGRPRFRLFQLGTEVGSLTPASIAELLDNLQEEATTAIDQFFNMADLLVASAGSFFYDSRAKNLRPEQWQVKLGQPIEVDSIDGILLNPLTQGLPAAMQALSVAIDKLKDWSELLTATSNPALGKETDTNRTAFEVRTVANQAATIFEDYAKTPAGDWAVLADMARWNLAQFGGGQQQYLKEIGGEPTFPTITADELLQPVTMHAAGIKQFSDPQSRIQRDLMLHDLLLRNPLTQQDWASLMHVLKTIAQDVRFPGWERLGLQWEQRAAEFIQAEEAMAQQQAQQELAARTAGPPVDPNQQIQQVGGTLQALGQAQKMMHAERQDGRAQEAHDQSMKLAAKPKPK